MQVQINIKNNNIIRLANRNYAGIDKHGWEQETDMGKQTNAARG